MTIQRVPFPEALMRERARLQLSRREVADQCGVAQGVVKRWERGEAIPSTQQFKRLVGMMVRLAPHAPDWGWAGAAVVDGRMLQQREEMAASLKELRESHVEPPRPPPQSFGDGLRRVREDNEITQDELGELLGVSGAAVSAWETDTNCPVQPNLDKLCEVMPELRAGFECGAIKRPASQDRPVPVGSNGRPPGQYPRASTIDTALAMAIESSEDERARPPAPRPPRHDPPVPPEPPPIPAPLAPQLPLIELANAYAHARVNTLVARRTFEAVQLELQRAQKALDEAEAREKEAHGMLDLAVADEAMRFKTS